MPPYYLLFRATVPPLFSAVLLAPRPCCLRPCPRHAHHPPTAPNATCPTPLATVPSCFVCTAALSYCPLAPPVACPTPHHLCTPPHGLMPHTPPWCHALPLIQTRIQPAHPLLACTRVCAARHPGQSRSADFIARGPPSISEPYSPLCRLLCCAHAVRHPNPASSVPSPLPVACTHPLEKEPLHPHPCRTAFQ